MEKYLTSLFDYKVKRHAIIFAVVIFLIDKLVYLFTGYINSYFHHILFNYLVCLGLLTAIGSKDKEDDERSLFIRYSILKNSFNYFVVLFGIIALFSNNFEIKELSMQTLLYCIQGVLVLHLVLLFLGNRFNPSWLFKEKTAPKDFNQMMIGFFYGFYFLTALIIGISFFIKS